MKLTPGYYGLPARTQLEKISKDTIALVMQRKSRIIMADGRKIAQKAALMKKVCPSLHVVLKTTAPICSKTKAFLFAQDIQIIAE